MHYRPCSSDGNQKVVTSTNTSLLKVNVRKNVFFITSFLQQQPTQFFLDKSACRFAPGFLEKTQDNKQRPNYGIYIIVYNGSLFESMIYFY